MGVNQSARSKHHIKENEEVNFDHFQILRAIGKGSFGKVCIVQKKDTGQMYAMKYMSKPACLERYAFRNVLREIEILTQLDHPFLVNLWFSFHDEEDMFLVQDLLLGGDLRYHLSQNVQFPVEAVKLYVAEIALALDYLQTKHIIHRDIKPDNILLDEEGHAHLTDFNVATLLDENQLATSLSGTKPYMAPEVFACSSMGDEMEGYGYDTSADWWSLGVVAYELSAGRRPYDIHSQLSNKEIQTILKVPPEWPRSWPKDLFTLVYELLRPNPKERLESLGALKEQSLMAGLDWDAVLEKAVPPVFVPPKGHLNCDPTFELEEMIVESKPLHKKKKRLAKQRSLREFQSSSAELPEPSLDPLAEEFTTFNRQKELERAEREKKEQEWEEELSRAMEASGLPSTSSAAGKDFRLSDSQLSSDPANPGSPSDRPIGPPQIPERSAVKLSKKLGFNGLDLIEKPTPNSKKSAWSKSRSITMPEGAKVWNKSHKS